MATDAQIQQLIDDLPIGVKDGINAQKIIDLFQALLQRELFSKQWGDLENVPQTLYMTDRHLALRETKTNAFTLHASKSGYVFFIDSSATLNITINTPDLPNGFECVLIQKREGAINLIDEHGVQNSTSTFYLPDDFLAQTENKMDYVYIVKHEDLIFIKGDLKPA